MSNKPYVLTANWNAPAQIKTLITTRIGGVSQNNYSSFNLAMHVNDNPNHVSQNRQILNEYLPNKPIWLNQTHSNLAIEIDNSTTDIIHDYDATLTRIKNIVCTVMTADCLPILLTDINGSFVSAIHAGWRGVANNIISNAVNLTNVRPKDILAYIGPAICQKHFEIGYEVFDIFTQLNSHNQQFFIKKDNNKFDCDLAAIAKLQLINQGILANNITQSDECTYCNDKLFYSFRRNSITGRFASCIWIE